MTRLRIVPTTAARGHVGADRFWPDEIDVLSDPRQAQYHKVAECRTLLTVAAAGAGCWGRCVSFFRHTEGLSLGSLGTSEQFRLVCLYQSQDIEFIARHY